MFEDYSLEWPLVQTFKRSRVWISGERDGKWDDGRRVALDAEGWVKSLEPGQIARSLLFWSEGSRHPLGEYVVRFDGEGELDFWNTATIVKREPGRYVIRVDEAPSGIAVFLTSTRPENPLRNIRVFLPGGACASDHGKECRVDAECSGSSCVPFESATWSYHPVFLSALAPYSVIRFMNWMRANESKERTWSDRPRLAEARWTVRGVPVEAMVELTNELRASPWFTLPIGADDDYFRRFAEYVRDHANGQKVYIELSNEVWNNQFPQARFAEEQGKRADLSRDAFEARLRWYSRRSRQMFQVFENVFGGTSRLVRVLGSQSANPWVSETVLGFEDAKRHTDALAIAPYFGGELGTQESPVPVRTLDGLMKELEGPAVDRAAKDMRVQAKVAREFGVELVAYEGGQHLVGVGGRENEPQLNQLFDAANRDSRMKKVYLRYLGEWRSHSRGVFVHFSHFGNYSKWGRWGAIERVGQARAESPKLDALLTFGGL